MALLAITMFWEAESWESRPEQITVTSYNTAQHNMCLVLLLSLKCLEAHFCRSDACPVALVWAWRAAILANGFFFLQASLLHLRSRLSKWAPILKSQPGHSGFFWWNKRSALKQSAATRESRAAYLICFGFRAVASQSDIVTYGRRLEF